MTNLSEKIMIGTFISFIAGSIFSSLCYQRAFGVRKTEDIYSFQYNGKQAELKLDDVRWGPDKYYFLLNEKDKLIGRLTTDDGKEINIFGFNDKNNKYSIRDKTTVLLKKSSGQKLIYPEN